MQAQDTSNGTRAVAIAVPVVIVALTALACAIAALLWRRRSSRRKRHKEAAPYRDGDAADLATVLQQPSKGSASVGSAPGMTPLHGSQGGGSYVSSVRDLDVQSGAAAGSDVDTRATRGTASGTSRCPTSSTVSATMTPTGSHAGFNTNSSAGAAPAGAGGFDRSLTQSSMASTVGNASQQDPFSFPPGTINRPSSRTAAPVKTSSAQYDVDPCAGDESQQSNAQLPPGTINASTSSFANRTRAVSSQGVMAEDSPALLTAPGAEVPARRIVPANTVLSQPHIGTEAFTAEGTTLALLPTCVETSDCARRVTQRLRLLWHSPWNCSLCSCPSCIECVHVNLQASAAHGLYHVQTMCLQVLQPAAYKCIALKNRCLL